MRYQQGSRSRGRKRRIRETLRAADWRLERHTWQVLP